MCLLGSDLSRGKALVSVVGDILPALTETVLYRDHFAIGVVLGAIDARNERRIITRFVAERGSDEDLKARDMLR